METSFKVRDAPINTLRRCIYNSWFYGFLAAVLWLDCGTDVSDFLERRRILDLISLASSTLAAVLTTLIFLDLRMRRGKP